MFNDPDTLKQSDTAAKESRECVKLENSDQMSAMFMPSSAVNAGTHAPVSLAGVAIKEEQLLLLPP